MNRPATEKEVRAHYKALGFEVRITSMGEVQFRRSRYRYPGSPQVWLYAGMVGHHYFDEKRGVYFP